MNVRTDDGHSVNIQMTKKTVAYEVIRSTITSRGVEFGSRFTSSGAQPHHNDLALVVVSENSGSRRTLGGDTPVMEALKTPVGDTNYLLVIGYLQKIKELIADEMVLAVKTKLGDCSNGDALEAERNYLLNSINRKSNALLVSRQPFSISSSSSSSSALVPASSSSSSKAVVLNTPITPGAQETAPVKKKKGKKTNAEKGANAAAGAAAPAPVAVPAPLPVSAPAPAPVPVPTLAKAPSPVKATAKAAPKAKAPIVPAPVPVVAPVSHTSVPPSKAAVPPKKPAATKPAAKKRKAANDDSDSSSSEEEDEDLKKKRATMSASKARNGDGTDSDTSSDDNDEASFQPHMGSMVSGPRGSISSSSSDDSNNGKGKRPAASKKNPLAGLGSAQKSPTPPSALAQTMGMLAGGKKKRGARPSKKKKEWVHPPPGPVVVSSLKSGTPTLGDWEATATLSPPRKNSTGSNNTVGSFPVTEALVPAEQSVKRKRGRPKGSKNKPKVAATEEAAAAAAAVGTGTWLRVHAPPAEDTDREDDPIPPKKSRR